jgi:hypothetical protein
MFIFLIQISSRWTWLRLRLPLEILFSRYHQYKNDETTNYIDFHFTDK